MKRVAALLCVWVAVGCTSQTVEPGSDVGDAGATDGSTDKPITAVSDQLGINLSGVNYYATQLPFSNLFMNRDRWLSTDGMTWDTEQANTVPTDADGYPLELPYKGLMLRASTFLPIHADTFDMTWKGDGELSVMGPQVEILSQTDNSLRFSAGPSLSDSVFVRVERSSAGDHVHAIEIHGAHDYGAQFKASLKGFHVLRFMDWGATNNNPVSRWSERTLPNQAQGSEHGVAIEHMIATANSAKANMWFTVPHKADDDYVQQAAKLIAEKLDKDLKVYVEYSNENWNGIFTQVQWEQARGIEAKLNNFREYGSPEEMEFWAGMNFAVRRAGYIHKVFRAELGERAIRVLSGQSANSGLNDAILLAYEDKRINPSGGTPDALAVAPYFGRIYNEPEKAGSITVASILADAEDSIDELVTEHTRENREIADAHGVHLIAYEAGQHVLIAGGLEKMDGMVQKMIDANRDPRMGELYRKAHRAWQEAGGELAVYFSSCEAPGQFGSWGALEYQDQPASEAPKWQALRGFMRD